jgi:hypothetical protein
MNKILITGNGFDLNMGLKTSYQDFLKSDEFKRLLVASNDKRLLNYLHAVQGEKNWVDIEDELKNFVLKLTPKKQDTSNKKSSGFSQSPSINNIDMINNKNIKDDYQKLKDALTIYLIRVQKMERNEEGGNKASENSDAAKLFENGSLIDENPNSLSRRRFNKIYTFNYTKTRIHPDINYLHGSLENDNIVFGVEDTANLPDGFEYLYKSSSPAYSKNTQGLAAEVNNCDELHFFGLSFGYTDDSHFKPLFKQLLNVTHTVEIFFYVHGKADSYYGLFKRLRELTEYEFSSFKRKHQPKFISLKDNKEIDDAWLRRNT